MVVVAPIGTSNSVDKIDFTPYLAIAKMPRIRDLCRTNPATMKALTVRQE